MIITMREYLTAFIGTIDESLVGQEITNLDSIVTMDGGESGKREYFSMTIADVNNEHILLTYTSEGHIRELKLPLNWPLDKFYSIEEYSCVEDFIEHKILSLGIDIDDDWEAVVMGHYARRYHAYMLMEIKDNLSALLNKKKKKINYIKNTKKFIC